MPKKTLGEDVKKKIRHNIKALKENEQFNVL